MVESVARQQLRAILERGESIIYDDLSLEREDRRVLRELAHECGVQPVVVYVDTPLSVIDQRREANRERDERGDIDEGTMLLDISLLQPPQTNDAVVVKPGYNFSQVVLEIMSPCAG